MKKIDHTLASNPPLSQTQLAEVRNLRVLGEHDRSVQCLGQAMQVLRNQQIKQSHQ